MKRAALLLVTLCGFAFASEHELTTAKVISQTITPNHSGTYTTVIGTAIVSLPLNRSSNRIVIETDKVRMTWVELGNKLLIVPVGGELKFYEDKDKFIVLDRKGKKHKFGLIGLEKKTEEPQK